MNMNMNDMSENIVKAREFYGIYDSVNDETVLLLMGAIHSFGMDYVIKNMKILKTISFKRWG